MLVCNLTYREEHLKRIALIILFVSSIAAIPATADTTNVTLTGIGGANQGGVYVAPYFLSLNGGTNITTICDDYTHDVYVGESWKATIQTFATLSNTRFGQAAGSAGNYGFGAYAEAAWLYTKFLGTPSQAGNINFAIWALFSPAQAEGNLSGWTLGAQTWLKSAQTWFALNCSSAADTCGGIDLSAFEFITPADLTSSDSPQEYITMTPEPGSLVLMGLGAILLAFVARRLQNQVGIEGTV